MQLKLPIGTLLVTVFCLSAPLAFAQKPDRAGNPLDKIVELESRVATLQAQVDALTGYDTSGLEALQEQVDGLVSQLGDLTAADADLQAQIDGLGSGGGEVLSTDVTGATYQFTQIGGYVGNSFNSLFQVSMSNRSFSYTFKADGTIIALYESCALINANINMGGPSLSSSTNLACPTTALTWTQDSGLVTVSDGGSDWLFAVSNDGSSMVSAPQITLQNGKYLEQHVQMGVRLSD